MSCRECLDPCWSSVKLFFIEFGLVKEFSEIGANLRKWERFCYPCWFWETFAQKWTIDRSSFASVSFYFFFVGEFCWPRFFIFGPLGSSLCTTWNNFACFFHFVILILTDRRLWRFFVFGHSQNFFDRKILCAKILTVHPSFSLSTDWGQWIYWSTSIAWIFRFSTKMETRQVTWIILKNQHACHIK